MRNGILIPVRTGSTRLPQKCLSEIEGKPAIQWLVERIKTCKHVDSITICTTQLPEDKILENYALKLGVNCFKGSTHDVLDRLKSAAVLAGSEYNAIVDGDDVLCDPEFIDKGLISAKESNSDYFVFDNLPFGICSKIVKTSALIDACGNKKTADTSTGFFNYILKHDNYKKDFVRVDKRYENKNARLTLDYPEDLEVFALIFKKFREVGYSFDLSDILNLLKRESEIVEINNFLSKEYWNNYYKNNSSSD
jgi:spore coat polysaccharide biosynthesis protein SpsF (cytidylyltransferase family)